MVRYGKALASPVKTLLVRLVAIYWLLKLLCADQIDAASGLADQIRATSKRWFRSSDSLDPFYLCRMAECSAAMITDLLRAVLHPPRFEPHDATDVVPPPCSTSDLADTTTAAERLVIARAAALLRAYEATGHGSLAPQETLPRRCRCAAALWLCMKELALCGGVHTANDWAVAIVAVEDRRSAPASQCKRPRDDRAAPTGIAGSDSAASPSFGSSYDSITRIMARESEAAEWLLREERALFHFRLSLLRKATARCRTTVTLSAQTS